MFRACSSTKHHRRVREGNIEVSEVQQSYRYMGTMMMATMMAMMIGDNGGSPSLVDVCYLMFTVVVRESQRVCGLFPSIHQPYSGISPLDTNSRRHRHSDL